MPDQSAKKPTEREWLIQKPTLKKLYLDSNQTLSEVRKLMETNHSFSASKWQYEKHFRAWDWRKNSSSNHWKQLSVVICERKCLGEETNVFIRDKLQSRDKIRKEMSRYRQPIQKRSSFTSTQQLPPGFRVQTPISDKTAFLTFDLPFRILEDDLRVTIHPRGYQNWSWQTFAAGPSNIDSRLTPCERPDDEEDLYLDSNLSFNQQFGTLEQPLSFEAGSPILTVSENWTTESSVLTALKSVVPKSITEEDTPSPSVRSLNTHIFSSSLHRQILFSVANNFAGLGAISSKDVFHYLRKETDETLYRLINSARTYSSRAIVRNLFKAAIEAGDARIVDVLIRENPKDIKVNELFLSVKGDKYTPIGRAIKLGHEDVIKTLLKRGADVNRTYSCMTLDYAIEIDGLQINSQTFRVLVMAGGIPSETKMRDLIGRGEGEFALLVVKENASKSAAEWRKWGMLQHVVDKLDDDISMEIIGIMLKHGADLNAVSSGIIRSPPPADQRLIDCAARRGKFGTVNFLLDFGALLTDHTLPMAVASGNQDLILLLLERGADINGITSFGITPLSEAIRLQDAQVLGLLEDNGAFDTMQGQKYLSAALKAASDVGNMQIIERLIQKGGKVNPETLSYALIGAIRTGRDEHAQVLNLIQDQGAFDTVQGQEHLSAPLKVAVDVGNMQIIETLIQIGGKVSPDNLGYALLGAIRTGRNKYAKILIDAGANVNVQMEMEKDHARYRVPLTQALERQNEAIVLSLLDADADPHYRKPDQPSMVLAAAWGNRSVMENLILAGADVNARDNESTGCSETALTIAVKGRNFGLIDLLLASGADISSSTTIFGGGEEIASGTALQAAAEIGDVEMARFLLDQGSDPNDSEALNLASKNDKLLDLLLERYKARYPTSGGYFGARTLAEAVVEGNEGVTKMILDKGVNPSGMIEIKVNFASPFGWAVATQHGSSTRMLEWFLDNGCHPHDVVTEADWPEFRDSARPRVTALLAAIGTLNTSTVELFIRNGADVNFPTRGPIKRTPLQRAAEVGSLDIVELLLNHGANVRAPAAERGGGTALQLAAIGGYISIACKLLDHNADPNAPASKVNGRTALEGAAEHGRLDMVQVLLNAVALSKCDDEADIRNAIALARENGHIPICDLLDSHLKSVTQGSGLGVPTDSNDGDLTGFSGDDDIFSQYVDLEGGRLS